MFASFRDGNYLTASTATQCKDGNTVNCTAKLQPNSNEEGYDDEWKQRIATENPENAARYRVPPSASEGVAGSGVRKLEVVQGKRQALKRSASASV